MIHIWTDGSSKGNPGPGGYGVVILQNNNIIYQYNKQENKITNNQAEIKAVLHAFELAQTKYANETCIIHSDSAYVVNMCNNWIFTWAKNNWINSKKKIVENVELIKSLYKYLSKDFFNCQVIHCKSHCGILENELADALATNDMNKFNKIVQEKNIGIIVTDNKI
jgi:ribonuclease HI